METLNFWAARLAAAGTQGGGDPPFLSRRAAHLRGLPRQNVDSIRKGQLASYLRRENKASSPTWSTFLANHVGDRAAIDFFVVPTATFRLLYCFVVLAHDRRRAIHFNVTAHPSAE